MGSDDDGFKGHVVRLIPPLRRVQLHCKPCSPNNLFELSVHAVACSHCAESDSTGFLTLIFIIAGRP